MFEKFKEIGRNYFQPIHLVAGDSLHVTYYRDETGEVVLCEAKINAEQAMVVDEAMLFEAVYEGRKVLGGMVLEKK